MAATDRETDSKRRLSLLLGSVRLELEINNISDFVGLNVEVREQSGFLEKEEALAQREAEQCGAESRGSP